MKFKWLIENADTLHHWLTVERKWTPDAWKAEKFETQEDGLRAAMAYRGSLMLTGGAPVRMKVTEHGFDDASPPGAKGEAK